MRHPKLPMTPEQFHDFACDPRNMQVDIVTLHKLNIEAQIAIDKRQLDVCNLAKREEWIDEMNKVLMHRLRLEIYGIKHDKHVVSYPENWLEAVKERFAPKWLLKRYPVKRTEITASLWETYPDLTPSIPSETPVYRLHINKTPSYYKP